MDSNVLRGRTRDIALRIIKLVAALPRGPVADVIGRQIMKSGTSIGANYREALRASSSKQFISMTEISLREAEETLYWLELLAESNLLKKSRLESISDECNQLVSIFVATVRSAKQRQRTTRERS
jgi:four helix bundle protein